VLDLLASLDIEDLSRAVAASSDESSITTETNTADDTLMGQVMDELNIQDAADAGVEDGVPILTFALEVVGQSLDLQIYQLVATATKLLCVLLVLRQGEDLLLLGESRRRGGARHGRGPWVRVCCVLLGGSRDARGTARVGSGLARARRGCRLGRCRAVACKGDESALCERQ
jgi:hypothetical protein